MTTIIIITLTTKPKLTLMITPLTMMKLLTMMKPLTMILQMARLMMTVKQMMKIRLKIGDEMYSLSLRT